MVMKHYLEDDDVKIRQNIHDMMLRTALGSGKQDGSPKKFLEIIELNEPQEEIS